jgi:hypothetical protein
VAHDDGLVDPDDGAELREVVGEVGDAVALLRSVALPDPPRIDRRDRMRLREVVELGLERGVVAAPARDEQQLGRAPPGALVEQPYVGEIRVRHDLAIVSGRAQKVQRTG